MHEVNQPMWFEAWWHTSGRHEGILKWLLCQAWLPSSTRWPSTWPCLAPSSLIISTLVVKHAFPRSPVRSASLCLIPVYFTFTSITGPTWPHHRHTHVELLRPQICGWVMFVYCTEMDLTKHHTHKHTHTGMAAIPDIILLPCRDCTQESNYLLLSGHLSSSQKTKPREQTAGLKS